MVVWAGYIVFTGYVFLSFPRGWLESTAQRRFMLAFVLSTALVWVLILALSPALPAGSDFTNCGTDCPHNALQIFSVDAGIGKGLVIASDIVFTAAALGVVLDAARQHHAVGRTAQVASADRRKPATASAGASSAICMTARSSD